MQDRLRGTLIGLTVGDALGAAVEFQPPGTFEPVVCFRGGGPHGLAPGEWTDDTSMALALADSLAESRWNLHDQLPQLPVAMLQELFGAPGRHYWELAHGQNHRPVVPDREAKSVSHETTFATDIADNEILRAWLVELVEQVARRLPHHDIQGRSVELKVRLADFATLTRSLTTSHFFGHFEGVTYP